MSDATIAGERVRELMSELDKLSDDYEGTVKVLTTFARSERLAALEEIRPHLKWALEQVADDGLWDEQDGGMCFCNNDNMVKEEHKSDCPYMAALRALEGDAGR